MRAKVKMKIKSFFTSEIKKCFLYTGKTKQKLHWSCFTMKNKYFFWFSNSFKKIPLLLSPIHIGSSLKCFKCTSKFDPNCDLNGALPVIDCSRYNPNNNEIIYCSKINYKGKEFNAKELTNIRFWWNKKNCIYLEKNQWITIRDCQTSNHSYKELTYAEINLCDIDLCNAADSPGALTLTAILFAPILLIFST